MVASLEVIGNDVKRREHYGNATQCCCVLCFVFALLWWRPCFLASFILSMLSLLADYDRYHDAYVVLQIVCHVLTVLAILGYVGIIVIGTFQSKSQASTNKSAGYVPLASIDETNRVPVQYRDF